MFITGGRAGQVMYFAMLTIIIFQFFNTQKIKALFLTSVLIPGIFFTAYTTSDIFQQRVDAAVKNTVYYSENKNTSVGLRITFTLNSWEVIKENPIIGVGTGDFPIEYAKIYQIKEEIHLLYKVFIYGELVKKLLTVVILLINYKITNYIILLVKRKKKNYY